MTTIFIATGARRLEYALYVQRPERSLKATLPSLALTMPQKNSARVMRLAVAGAARQTQFTVTRKAGSGYYRHKRTPQSESARIGFIHISVLMRRHRRRRTSGNTSA